MHKVKTVITYKYSIIMIKDFNIAVYNWCNKYTENYYRYRRLEQHYQPIYLIDIYRWLNQL